jgi:thymidylate synthase
VAQLADPFGGHIDKITQVLEQIRSTPDSRRMTVSTWNVADIPQMKLPPCRAFFQFYVADGKLSCQLYQRSADIFLGMPFNIASYALLTHMLAQQAGLEVGDFVWTGGDCHPYSNHLEQAELQLTREPLPLPTLVIKRHRESLLDYRFEDFEFVDYQSRPPIKAPVATGAAPPRSRPASTRSTCRCTRASAAWAAPCCSGPAPLSSAPPNGSGARAAT